MTTAQLPTFCAIDFETADYGSDSACALAVIRVENGVIADQKHIFIRPPRTLFAFTHIHGITWDQVKAEPTFAQWWPSIESMFTDVSFITAHNAAFDRKVLTSCCEKALLRAPELPYLCTVRLCRKVWNIRPTTLDNVCHHLSIPLNHHEALSDALACARIVIMAQRVACEFPPFMGESKRRKQVLKAG